MSEAQCFGVVRTSEVARHLHHPWALAVISKMSIIFNSLCLCIGVSMSRFVYMNPGAPGGQRLNPPGTRVTGSCESSCLDSGN